MLSALGISPTLVGFALMGIAWFGSTVFLLGKGKVDLYEQKRIVTADVRDDERRTCNVKFDTFIDQINGAADSEVAAGNEAAEMVPWLKERGDLAKRCATSPYCRKSEPTLVPSNGTEAPEGGD